MDILTESRTCSRCSRKLPLASFYRISKKPHLTRSQCRECMIDLNKMVDAKKRIAKKAEVGK